MGAADEGAPEVLELSLGLIVLPGSGSGAHAASDTSEALSAATRMKRLRGDGELDGGV